MQFLYAKILSKSKINLKFVPCSVKLIFCLINVVNEKKAMEFCRKITNKSTIFLYGKTKLRSCEKEIE